MWPTRATFRYFYLARLSRPAADRPIYRLIRRQRMRRIVELGVGAGERSLRMIEMAADRSSSESVVFTGVDLFELRTPQDGPGLPLKQVHRKLAATGAKIRLLPGDPHAALSRAVNMLGTADLIVIAADQQRAAVERSWYFVERLLHPASQVLLEEPASEKIRAQFRTVPHDEIRRLAAATTQRRRAA